MKDILFVLGADDPEMREIEHILTWYKRQFQYATKGGKRVHPGNAYQADPMDVSGFEQVVFIECEIPLPSDVKRMRIDHHRPGDPGYELPPSQFWHASSIGQLSEFLGISMEVGSHDNVILAAMDHCPAAAIRGECPGVSAQEVLDRKVSEIAASTKYSPEEVRSRIEYYTEKIWLAPEIMVAIEGRMLRDMREFYLGEGYSLDLLAVQTAALASGYAVLLWHRDAPGKPEKWSISGHASPFDIEGFMKYWAPAKGLTGIYGVPSRGYAGGYFPQD